MRGRGASMSPYVYRRKLRVEWGQCDPAGIMFNRRFFEIFDANTWSMFEGALGVAPHKLAEHFGILGIPLVDARANFLKPVKFGDAIEVVSTVSEFRRSSFDVQHSMSTDAGVAAEGRETRVWAARNRDNPEKMGATPIPDVIVERFGHRRG